MDWRLNYTGEQVKQEINHNWPADWQDWPLWSGSRQPPRQHGQCGVWWWTGSGHRWSWEEEKRWDGGWGGGGGAETFNQLDIASSQKKKTPSQIYIKELHQHYSTNKQPNGCTAEMWPTHGLFFASCNCTDQLRVCCEITAFCIM